VRELLGLLTSDHKSNTTDMGSNLDTHHKCYGVQTLTHDEGFHLHVSSSYKEWAFLFR